MKRAKSSQASNGAKHTKKASVLTRNITDDQNGVHDVQPKPIRQPPKFINLKNGKELFKSFLGDDIQVEDFLQNYWEQKPLVIKRSDNADWLDYIKDLFSFDKMKQILTDNKLLYGIDINLCKLVDEKKKVFNKKGNAKPDFVCKSFENDKMTIQFHQPQRFSDELWQLLEKFECYFDCLVGSNIYMTPAGSQGLAPHFDDIEAFVIQLEGSKQWLLYEPTVQLPNTYSNDMNAKDLKEPIYDIVLNQGDILYFPRGVIHQAVTPENDKNMHSTHITISTYQDFNRMEYISTVISEAIENSFKNNLELRRGVPVHFFRSNNFNTLIKSTFQNIELENNACYPVEMMKDFQRNRLPPFGLTDIPDANHELKSTELENLKHPNESFQVKLKYPEHMFVILTYEENDEELSEEDDEPEAKRYFTFLFHSAFNLRDFHMMQEQENDNCLKMNESCYEIMKFLVEKSKDNNDEWFSISKIENLINKTIDKIAFGEILLTLATENLIDFKIE